MGRRNYRRAALSLVICMLMLLAAACGGGAASGGEGKPSSQLTIGVNVSIPSFDIHNQNNGVVEGIFNNIFNYLVKRDNNGVIHGDLAEKYEQVDEAAWHFTLKKGVKFHNGDPLTSQDVKFSLERIAKDKKLLQNDFYKQIKEVKIIDDTSFNIITDGADPSLLNRLSRIGSGILPKKYVDEKGWDYFLKHPVGTGPYQFSELLLDDKLVLTKFADYFEGNVTDFDTVVFRMIPEASTRVGELLSGGIDIASEIPPADWDRIKNRQGTSLLSADSTAVMLLLARSTEGSPTADPRVRQAIDYAINDKAIIDNLLKSTATPTLTRATKGIKDADEALFNKYNYDPEKSKQLLKEAGYPNGLELTLQSPQGKFMLDSDVSQMVAGMLSEVGVKVKVEFLESSKYTDISNTGKNKDLILMNRTNSMFDASLALADFSSKTNPKGLGYNNPKVDELLDKAAVNMNAQERTEQYKQVQEIVAQDSPYIYLYLEKYFTGVKDGISFQPRMDKAILVRDIKKK